MMGNWSLGDYFKNEQLNNLFTFLTDPEIGLGLDPKRLYVTAFEGNDSAPQDKESIEIWKDIFHKAGMEAKIGERIFLYGAEKNWWSRAGVPENMPAGEPGGPDSEVFYQFDVEHDPSFGEKCHPNCDCGRFMEIGNSVFMQYKKMDNGTFAELPKMNVDFGGGLERLLAAANDDPDIFKTDVFSSIVKGVEKATGISYGQEEFKPAMRIIADHLKTATFIIKDGITPSNKEQGYILRRLLRRALVKVRALNNGFSIDSISPIIEKVLETYDGIYFDISKDKETIIPVITQEIVKFQKTLEKGLREIEKLKEVNAKQAFDLYQSYGFPLEITQEILEERGQKIDRKAWKEEVQKHREKSRSSALDRFKGGLADHSEQTVRYHTATHLIHQALFDILGDSVRQEGSNITAERLRFDFYSVNAPAEDAKQQIEEIVNGKIKEALTVQKVVLPKTEAEKVGARSFFKEKYPDQVNVYFIGGDADHIKDAYSKEFCGGPHVTNTSEIGHITIEKLKKIGSNMYRVYAK
ncbi:alanine--tRNA ligase [Candidatus Roizmanbacteria bacterium]|nr:MAG: alanine--tRNA ligase [Candidatus Roizmanbacteria bacterium]